MERRCGLADPFWMIVPSRARSMRREPGRGKKERRLGEVTCFKGNDSEDLHAWVDGTSCLTLAAFHTCGYQLTKKPAMNIGTIPLQAR